MTSWPRSTASSPPSTPAIRQPPRWSGACAPSAASALWCPPCWPPCCSASRFATPMHWSPMSAWTRVLMNPAAAAAVVDCPNAGTPSGAAFWSPPPCPPRARASGATMSWATKTKDCPQQPYTSSSRARCCGSPSPSTNPATTSSRRKSNLLDNNHRIFRGYDGPTSALASHAARARRPLRRVLAAMLRRPVGGPQVACGVDERHVRQRLREVAEHHPVDRVVLLGEEADVVAQREEPLEQALGLAPASGERERIGEPERAGQERAFASRQAVGRGMLAVAHHEPVANELA